MKQLVLLLTIVTYTGSARLIFERRCTMCHGSRWLDYNRAKADAKQIRYRVWETKTMPPGNITGASDKEREMIRQWVDGGALK